MMKMNQQVEFDAAVPNFEYKSALLTVYNQLRISEFQSLKFLCSDFISAARMEQIRNVLDLFQELEKLCKIGEPANVGLLAELLFHIGRSDLLKALCCTKTSVAKISAEEPSLNLFRVMLFKISEQLSSNETRDLLFMYGAQLPKSRRETINSPEELFQALEKQGLLSQHDASYVASMMNAISRSDLVELVQKFMGRKAKAELPNEKSRYRVLPKDTFQCRGIQESLLPFESHDPTIHGNQSSYSSSLISPSPTTVTVGENRFVRETSTTHGRGSASQFNDFGVASQVFSCEDNNASGCRSRVFDLVEDESLELPCYPMTRKPRGYCVIISNEHFYNDPSDSESRKMPDREGTQKDLKLLEQLFFHKLNFIVHIHQNLTAKDLSKTLSEMAFQMDHSKYDCFVCCILSHGVLGSIYGVDGRTIEIRDLTNFFKGATCPTLRGKPKLFFIQACQGKDKQSGFPVVADAPRPAVQETETETVDLVETIPNEADFLIGYATVPGYVSFRSKSQGSWYINTLVDMLYKYCDRYDLLSILIKVNEEVSRAIASMRDGTYKQSPMPMATLRKRIFFR